MTRDFAILASLCFSLALSGALLAESPQNQPSNTAARPASEHRAVLDRVLRLLSQPAGQDRRPSARYPRSRGRADCCGNLGESHPQAESRDDASCRTTKT